MGGIGSGRHAGGGRPLVEDGLTLDIVRLMQGGTRTAAGRLIWSSRGDGWRASIGYKLDALYERGASLTLSYVVGQEKRPVRQRIELDPSWPHFGGVRFWMTCPATGRRCRKLYHRAGCDHFVSREALGLAYASQREGEMERALRRCQKILVELGGTGDTDETAYLPKPKWMRWRTFNSEMAKAREADAKHWSCGLERFGGVSDAFSRFGG